MYKCLFLDCYDLSSKKYAQTITDTRIETPTYPVLLRSAVSIGGYSELMHIYALSAALATPIHSIFPANNSFCDFTHSYNVVVYGR